MLKKMDEIELYKGGASVIEFDMTDFQYAGGHVDFMLEDENSEQLFSYSFNEQAVYSVIIPHTLTSNMEVSRRRYSYGLMHCVEGERFPLCLKSPVSVSAVAASRCPEAEA